MSTIEQIIEKVEINNEVGLGIFAIKDLPFDKFQIPEYQRPYKWEARNVNQLINDIIHFSSAEKPLKPYRLGTLVLHYEKIKNDSGEETYVLNIVDGQQRMTTLSLIIRLMHAKLSIGEYAETCNAVELFHKSIKFSNKYSVDNLARNIKTIDERSKDIKEDVFKFIMDSCQLSVVVISDLSEAFQFFDSQNARGKALEPEDLLKAFHLRAIPERTEADLKRIEDWERLGKGRHRLFTYLYRAKMWPEGRRAYDFTQHDIDIFKGVDCSDERSWYPFYLLELRARIYVDMLNADPTIKQDKKLEYPYNLDDQIINGRHFFDMITHYNHLYEWMMMFKEQTEVASDDKYKEIRAVFDDIYHYPGANRVGDKRVRGLFKLTLLYYLDRFGTEDRENVLESVVNKIFIWAYSIRVNNYTLGERTIINEVLKNDDRNILRKIHEARNPYDIINIAQNSISKVPKESEKRVSGLDGYKTKEGVIIWSIIGRFEKLNKVN